MGNMGDIGSVIDGLASVNDCQAKCGANAHCKIFVYDPQDKKCWLKCAVGVDCSGANGATEDSGPSDRYMSGSNLPQPANCADQAPTTAASCFATHDYNMGDIGSVIDGLASVNDCQAKCGANAHCKIFVYDPQDKKCWLKCAVG